MARGKKVVTVSDRLRDGFDRIRQGEDGDPMDQALRESREPLMVADVPFANTVDRRLYTRSARCRPAE